VFKGLNIFGRIRNKACKWNKETQVFSCLPEFSFFKGNLNYRIQLPLLSTLNLDLLHSFHYSLMYKFCSWKSS